MELCFRYILGPFQPYQTEYGSKITYWQQIFLKKKLKNVKINVIGLKNHTFFKTHFSGHLKKLLNYLKKNKSKLILNGSKFAICENIRLIFNGLTKFLRTP